jgi:hypothetical protein
MSEIIGVGLSTRERSLRWCAKTYRASTSAYSRSLVWLFRDFCTVTSDGGFRGEVS